MKVDRSWYVDRLYPLQDEVLQVLGGLDTGFYLSGGTAASRGYLHHRFSDDLDLFVNDDKDFGLWAERFIQALAARPGWSLTVALREPRFVRLTLTAGGTPLKIEMIDDVPAHIGQIREDRRLGRLDSPENILANKVTALLDREEPKDLADIWGFCCRLGLSLDTALEGAGSKAAGIFPADVARLLCTAAPADWEVVRWDDGPAAEQFVADLTRLGERLLLLPHQ